MNAGGTLDLAGYVQYVGNLTSYNAGVNQAIAGGTITSSTGNGIFITNSTNNPGNFSGTITDSTAQGTGTGVLTFERAGTFTLNLLGPNTYTGATYLTGGTTTLKDYGTLANTSSVNLNYATLVIDNTGLVDMAARVNASAPFNMNGGTLQYLGRAQTASTETLGQLSLLQGAGTITVTPGGTGVNSATLTFGGTSTINADRSIGATVNFTPGTTGTLGQIGNNPQILFSTPPSMTNNVIGPWAIVNSNDFATYNATYGVGAVAPPGFRSYDGTFASGNITQVQVTTLLTANTTTGMLNLAGGNQVDVAFSNPGTVLNLQQGGLLRSNNANPSTIGQIATITAPIYSATQTYPGILTAGGTAASGNTELVVYNAASTVTINSLVEDTSLAIGSGSATISLVKSGLGTLTLSPQLQITGAFITPGSNGASIVVPSTAGLSPGMPVGGTGIAMGTTISSISGDTVYLSTPALGNGNTAVTPTFGYSNSYSGGTYVDQGTLNLNAVGLGSVVIPAGGLTISGGTVTMNNFEGQIAASNAVTINGNSTLTLFGDNTLASLAFNNLGGTAPTVNTGGLLTLSGGTISSSTLSVTATNTLAGALYLGGSGNNFTFNVSPILVGGVNVAPLQASLNVTAAMRGAAGLIETGGGVLQIAAISSYSGQTQVEQGSLQFSGTTVGMPYSQVNLSSGTQLNVNGATALVGSLVGSGVVTNASSTAGTLTFGWDNSSTNAANPWSGTFARYSDGIPSSLNVTKVGTGTFVMSGANTSQGTLTVSQGGVTLNGATTMIFNDTVNGAGTLTLDNNSVTSQNVNDRLGGGINSSVTLTLGGGVVNIIGNSAASTTEMLGNVITLTGVTTTTAATNDVTVASTAGLVAGMFVSGPGITSGTTISSIVNGTTLTLRRGATVAFPGTVRAPEISLYAATGGVTTLASGGSVLTLNAAAGQTMTFGTGSLSGITAGVPCCCAAPTWATSRDRTWGPSTWPSRPHRRGSAARRDRHANHDHSAGHPRGHVGDRHRVDLRHLRGRHRSEHHRRGRFPPAQPGHRSLAVRVGRGHQQRALRPVGHAGHFVGRRHHHHHDQQPDDECRHFP